MTDAELIRKQAEKIIELEEACKAYNENLIYWQDFHADRTEEVENAEKRCTVFARKLKEIEDEVNTYQFDSATNLQNKIKTILMSESGANEH